MSQHTREEEVEIDKLRREKAEALQEVRNLRTENESLREDVKKFQKYNRIPFRQLVEECRTKCRSLLQQAGHSNVADWNRVVTNVNFRKILESKGLDSDGLEATLLGVGTCQEKGNLIAHELADMEEYAGMICALPDNNRKPLTNVFRFMYGQDPEEVAFRV